MNCYIKWIVVLMVASASVAIASISLDFTADSRFSDLDRLFIKGSLVLDFSIDHSGKVLLDASVDKKNTKDIIRAVNGWDGVVGTVVSPSLFNTTFTFTANGWRRNDAGSLYVYQDITINGDQSGYLGVSGQDAGAIDGASSPHKNHEMLVWTLATSSADLQVELSSFGWDGRVKQQRSFMLFDYDTTNSWYGQPSAEFMNLSGYMMGNGEQITLAIPEDAIVGCGLSGFTLEVTSSEMTAISSKFASRKPTMIGLLIN